ncbi:MAG: fused signal recognition particle receptor [Gammaproteobacteria bacterium]|jgi:fused signal recognition particle receptor
MFGIKEQKHDSATDGFFQLLRTGLHKTRTGLLTDLGDIVSGKQKIEPQQLEEIESRLLMADLGIESTKRIMDALSREAKSHRLGSKEEIIACLREQMIQMLTPVQAPIEEIFVIKKPFVILVIGVNGVGKTTTIGKMANYFSKAGDKVLLAAGDTFRAAAIEQIQSWGEKNNLPVIAQQSGSDSAAVIYDALQSARARDCDIVIADTAGRLHNKDNLMEELKKIRRTISKFDDELDLEVLLVVDAGTGQNAISQVRLFHEAVGVTGIALTKLDGTAKGGVVFALAQTFNIPVRFIGVGEKIDDFRAFNASDFVDALLDTQT